MRVRILGVLIWFGLIALLMVAMGGHGSDAEAQSASITPNPQQLTAQVILETVAASTANAPPLSNQQLTAEYGREDLDNTTDERIMRGGSWKIDQTDGRSTLRINNFPDDSLNDFGFRCVRADE